MQAIVLLHTLVFRLAWWCLKLPVKAILATVQAMVALLGEEFRRWMGLGIMGLLLYVVSRVVMSVAPDGTRRPVALTLLVVWVIWAMALVRSARYTRHNNLRAVRTRQLYRNLDQRTAQLPRQIKTLQKDVRSGAARKARGTPVEDAFRENRASKKEARELARVAADRAEQDRREQQRRNDRLDNLPPDHDPFQ